MTTIVDQIADARVIETDTDTGSHWDHIRAPAAALREYALDCAATLALARGQATADDLERLEIELPDHDYGNADEQPFCRECGADSAGSFAAGPCVSEDFGQEDAMRVADERPLEVRHARWTLSYLRDPSAGALASVVVVLGTGGPHVEVRCDFDTQGNVERVEMEQRWSGVRRAVCRDRRLCAIVAEYVTTFYAPEDC